MDDRRMSLNSDWENRHMRWRPVGLTGYYTLLFRCGVHVLVTSSRILEHTARERWMRERDREEDERKYERGRGELSQYDRD